MAPTVTRADLSPVGRLQGQISDLAATVARGAREPLPPLPALPPRWIGWLPVGPAAWPTKVSGTMCRALRLVRSCSGLHLVWAAPCYGETAAAALASMKHHVP